LGDLEEAESCVWNVSISHHGPEIMEQMSSFGKLIKRDKLDELFSSHKIASMLIKLR